MNNQQLDQVFVDFFLRDGLRDGAHKKIGISPLYDRRNLLNAQLEITEEVIFKLRKVNAVLWAEEQRVRKHIPDYCLMMEQWVADKVIDDYELDVELQCYNDDYYLKLHQEFEGNPFWKEPLNCFGKWMDNDPVYLENWNHIHRHHPLANEFYCYSFHCLLEHTPLALEDMMRIDSICIEVKILHQFNADVKNSETLKE